MDEQEAMQEGATLQQQFDTLTQQKIELWNRIKGNQLYELTDEWKEIAKIDTQLRDLRFQLEGVR